MLFRAVLVGIFALLAIAQIIRTAAVAAFIDDGSTVVANLWPSHPKVLRSRAMWEVGEAAALGQPPGPKTLRRVERLAEVAPLYPEPFLVHGALAQRTGDYQRAEGLLIQARKRDPRSRAARYLLADQYLRTGRVLPGVAEISMLARLVPGGAAQLAPALAEFARTSGSVPQVKSILRTYPELKPALLSHLAEDPGNAGLILSLAGPGSDASGAPNWLTKLINNLIEKGQYDKAYSIWSRLSGVEQGSRRGLFNPSFRRSDEPPPFNWALSSTGGGIAEPEADSHGLHVLYFGRENVVLARQLLRLPTGRYGLAVIVSGELGNARAISWTLTCLPDKQQVLDLPLAKRSEANSIGGTFEVPARGCDAQWLELKGEGQEFPKPADLHITGLQLTRLSG